MRLYAARPRSLLYSTVGSDGRFLGLQYAWAYVRYGTLETEESQRVAGCDKYLTLPEEQGKNLFFYHHRCFLIRFKRPNHLQLFLTYT